MHNEIIDRLCLNGYIAHIVGGAVRDIISGQEPKDFDIVTNAKLNEILDIFKDKKVDLVGANFQVAIVEGIEVATYRIDVYTDNDLQTVVAETINDDLSRRDLTINSIAMCPYSGDAIDLFGGINDLKNKIIRFTGNPEKRIYEDPCRILRACRFLSKIKGTFELNTFYALNKFIDNIGYIANERKRIEILKTMEYDKPSIFFLSLSGFGGMKYLFQSLQNLFSSNLSGGNYHDEMVWDHCMITGNSISKKYPLLRLAGYLHDVAKLNVSETVDGNITFHNHESIGEEIVREELTNLKFSNEEIKYICNLILFHMRSLKDISPKALRKLIANFYKYDINYKDFLRLKIADRKANLKKENFSFSEIKRMLALFKCEYRSEKPKAFSIKDLAVDGNDVMNILEISPCRMVGDVLKELLEVVLENPELNIREELIKIIEGRKCHT